MKATAPPRSVDVTVVATAWRRGTSTSSLDGQTLPAVAGLARSAVVTARPGAQGSGPQHVIAPMPGKIVRVLVKPGDDVEARQGLVVVEAMKMENELRASRAGRVKSIKVAEGQSVDAGTCCWSRGVTTA